MSSMNINAKSSNFHVFPLTIYGGNVNGISHNSAR